MMNNQSIDVDLSGRPNVKVGTNMKGRYTGSALVMTLLMISVLSTVSFAVTALVISETRKASSLHDAIAAYYAAESGLEHGLMQYRIWRDAEVSREAYAYYQSNKATRLPDSAAPTKDQGAPQEYRLSGGPVGFLSADERDRGTTRYGLKMSYKTSRLGDVDANGQPVIGPNSPRILRDSAIDLDVTGSDGIHLIWEPDPESERIVGRPFDPLSYRFFVELIATSTDPNCQLSRGIAAENDLRRLAKKYINLPGPEYRLIINPSCEYNRLRIKPWGMNYIKYSLFVTDDKDGTNNTVKIDSNRSDLSVIGYSGRSKRQLNLTINRSTGTILESEDFLLLSGEKSISF